MINCNNELVTSLVVVLLLLCDVAVSFRRLVGNCGFFHRFCSSVLFTVVCMYLVGDDLGTSR